MVWARMLSQLSYAQVCLHSELGQTLISSKIFFAEEDNYEKDDPLSYFFNNIFDDFKYKSNNVSLWYIYI